MARNRNKNRVFRFNRRIRGQTDYAQRLELLKSGFTRIVVRRSNSNVLVQFVDYDGNGDKIITAAKSVDLKKLGFTLNTGNIVSAYLTGYLAGKRAQIAKVKGDCIVDFGLQSSLHGSRLFAAVKGVVDSGVKVRVGEAVFPSEERLSGAHLSAKDVNKVVEATKKAIEGMK
ncbi:MAG: 50S ribosomal protein L18 [Candidatus Woesearchaeota archaeon]|jgi:large subunit ribosomal protein L18|nr:50S ribosomal protein L18 [Candidatus Woesearchaeota archaeon]